MLHVIVIRDPFKPSLLGFCWSSKKTLKLTVEDFTCPGSDYYLKQHSGSFTDAVCSYSYTYECCGLQVLG